MTKTVLDWILEVFDSVSSWFAGAINDLVPMFYDAETGLTFLGVLSVASLGISIVLLLIRIIGSFLGFQR